MFVTVYMSYEEIRSSLSGCSRNYRDPNPPFLIRLFEFSAQFKLGTELGGRASCLPHLFLPRELHRGPYSVTKESGTCVLRWPGPICAAEEWPQKSEDCIVDALDVTEAQRNTR
ncbi:hypothetical protein E2C01_011985 [Portunus trituberculatus]|uniref:Uncharacterized protein n=1 Tax=Portunus trituberculatus TaxID=210409 RepID=A0A5B7DCX6_PORTR|nr:hypothetical protein [Portunus trituberculatus]